MPIELGEVEQESEEVRKLKETVRTVANKYTAQHGWCDVVNQALREAGVDQTGTLMEVEIDVVVTSKVPCRIDIGALRGKSAEEINETLKETLNEVGLVPAFNVPMQITNRRGGTTGRPPLIQLTNARRPRSQQADTSWDVTDVNEWTPPPPPRGEGDDFFDRLRPALDPAHYAVRFTSHEGRVMHIVNLSTTDRRGEISRALCGGSGGYYTRNTWPTSSARSEHRLCRNCMNNIGVTLAHLEEA